MDKKRKSQLDQQKKKDQEEKDRQENEEKQREEQEQKDKEDHEREDLKQQEDEGEEQLSSQRKNIQDEQDEEQKPQTEQQEINKNPQTTEEFTKLLLHYLVQIDESIKNSQRLLEEQKEKRETIQAKLTEKEKQLQDQLESENKLIEENVTNELKQSILKGGIYINNLTKENDSLKLQMKELEQDVINAQKEVLELHILSDRTSTQYFDSNSMAYDYEAKQAQVEDEQIHLFEVRNEKRQVIVALEEEVNEMNAVILKLEEVRGTLNKVIAIQSNDKQKQQTQTQQSVKQSPNMVNNKVKEATKEQEQFWYNDNQNDPWSKSPLRLPKVSQRQY